MATSPLTAVCGYDPFSDLLFSPRPAFIWNHTRKSVAWMNPAARTAFAKSLEDFSRSLPSRLIRTFSQFVEAGTSGAVKIKAGRGPALQFSAEPLKLSGGQDGLIVTAITPEGSAQKRSHTFPVPETAKGLKKRARKAHVPGKKLPKKRAPLLTEEELRAFKAVGRKVRRLCEEKGRANQAACPQPSPPTPGRVDAMPSAEQALQALKDVITAFDLVLFLGGGLDIIAVKGRAQTFGWRKSDLQGQPIGELLPFSERALLQRMLNRLRTNKSRTSREALLAFSAAGNSVPCRAVLGRWEAGGAAYFLALVSLKLPARLNRRRQAAAHPEAIRTRLAA